MKSVEEIKAIIGGDKAEWVKRLATGECEELVSGKIVTANASEIFNPIHTYEKMVKKLQLVVLDLIAKVNH